MTIETAHLRLIPFSPQYLLALIDGKSCFEKSFGLPVVEGLRGLYVSGDVSPGWLAQLRTTTQADPWVHGFAVVHLGSTSQSSAGWALRDRPPRMEWLRSLMGSRPISRGKATPPKPPKPASGSHLVVKKFVSFERHTLPTPNASTRVLLKCGFQRKGEIVDPEDGLVWRWERRSVMVIFSEQSFPAIHSK